MALDLQKLSIQEIRERFLDGNKPVSGQVLAKLQKDSREGVRSIYRMLEKRRRQHRREQIRMKSLLYFEEVLWNSGIQYIAGVDEVGIGPLAGPVVAAAVIFPPHTFVEGVNDSKKLDPRQREVLRDQILQRCLAHSIAVVDVEEVDQLNVYHAGLEGMRRAIEMLSPGPQHVLVDAREIPKLPVAQNKFDKGDGINFSIAAASILAKTHRDALMDQLHELYPQYGFDSHRGYSTKQHQSALKEYGPSPIHRRSFPFVREVCGKFSEVFYGLKSELYSAGSPELLKQTEERFLSMQADLTEYEIRKLRLCCKRLWASTAQARKAKV
ncbi:MAG TPA: ribonuclease HII [Acidobacteriota bacterium]|jgi:ribonuclease HII